MTVSNTGTRIVKEITINAPAPKIFAALTEPEQLKAWWGQDDLYHVEHMEADVRPGGRWRSTGRGTDGVPFGVEGVYRVVEPPHLLEYTWNYDWGKSTTETIVRFELIDEGAATIVRLTHSGFTDHEAREDHDGGWTRVLGWLAKFVE
jgi:uncharacterized protein YndB with AHSA1/START domain